MSELESAEDYSYRIDATLTHKEAVRCIEARDNAVRIAAISEVKLALLELADDLTNNEMYVLSRLREKYQTKEASDA